MTKTQEKQMAEFIRRDAEATKQQRWEKIGVCGMDTAGLLIADPCYVIATRRTEAGTLEANKSAGESVEIDDYNAWVRANGEVVNLPFKRGHDGAGVIVHSPHGDGSVIIWAKRDGLNRVRSVFFSFDGEEPEVK